jgi:RnfABCDGE-type electron transport complex B subunit
MAMSIILVTALFALALAFAVGVILGFFKELFSVPEDPAVTKIREVLPGANCGACGYPGCESFAVAVVEGSAKPSACTVGGQSTAEKVAAITGGEAGKVEETVAILACQGSSIHTKFKGTYTGIKTCRGAKIAGGTKLCSWGCLGFGDCLNVCQFGALSLEKNDLPKVDFKKCTGCGLCVSECPMDLFQLTARNQKGAIVLCANKNPVKQQVAKTCRISCFKCGLCVRSCPENCINLETHIPVVDYSKCNSCRLCVEKCPSKVFKLIEELV